MSSPDIPPLPGLNCGLCGHRTCAEFAGRLEQEPAIIKRCIYSSTETIGATPSGPLPASRPDHRAGGGVPPAPAANRTGGPAPRIPSPEWRDSLDREFDFYLDHFPEDPGPREVILPHNPMLTREMEMKPGEVMIGRPLGISCGCPVTHCGVVMDVDEHTGVMTWCVTGPLAPREKGFKDVGYYTAEAYEGLIKDARCEIKIGARYFFQPRMCMLQWRHSGLVNYLNRTAEGLQVRLEGLWIG